MVSRGSDPATERRRLRESESEDTVGRFLDATFWVSAEAFLFGLPTLAWAMLYGSVAVTFVMVVALSSFCLVGGAARTDQSGGEEGSDSNRRSNWPPVTFRLVTFRVAYFNAILFGAVAAGEIFVAESIVEVSWATDPVVGPAAVAGLLAGLGAWLFPTVASAVNR